MLKTAILIVVITQAWAMPDHGDGAKRGTTSCTRSTCDKIIDLGRSIKRLTREAASDLSDACQTAVQCGETFTTQLHENSKSTAEQDCGFFSEYIACLSPAVDGCPALNQTALDYLGLGQYHLCDYPWKACSVAFPCATDFLTLYTGNFGQAGSDDCSNARTYKNCLTTYNDSCPWIKQLYIMSDANRRLSSAC